MCAPLIVAVKMKEFLIKCPHTAQRIWTPDEIKNYVVKLCIAKLTFSRFGLLHLITFELCPSSLLLEAGRLLIKMWAPEHFHGGEGWAGPQRSCLCDDRAKATATICFSLDGRVCP